MFKKNLFTLLLTMLLVLGIAATSYADPGKGKGKGHWKFTNYGKRQAVQLVDINSHWAANPIQVMSSYGIINGYADFTFRPNANVTKYEAIMMISRACGFTGTFDSGRDWDSDVPSWMADCLDFAVNEGILTEEEAEDLNGWAPAKRYEVAIWAIRATGLEENSEFSFQDMDEIPYFARPYVGEMYKCGYMVGYPGNFFQPNKPVTRAEMATVLYRILLDNTDNGEADDNDGEELEIARLEPADGSYDVDEDTAELVVKFNMDIKAIDNTESVLDGIIVENVTDDTNVDIDEVSIEGKILTVKLYESLESGKTYRVTIEDDIIEAEDSGENFDGISGGEWEFSTDETFGIAGLTPEDGETVNEDTYVLEAEFSGDIRAISGKKLLNAVEVYNQSDDEYVDIEDVEIDGDTLIITLEDPLENGDTFEVTIKADYIEEKDTGVNFKGIDGADWEFTVEE
ncbi:S-layer homology domain-containing protein [Pelotomaculum sp. PtaB.Bin117]|uniref:S-layer homology domain-containing protein n=1 Tax=Pelotomaculum sp. PtaB.Bin117 TaxID=1811694 RepID=UPI0009C79AD3|nr:S-layer homology domain-containing protein [Pelotomaculum sp. PtaB.Bin117]OPX89610.1 MAG: Endo-1,4-beta-xylanase A precursor [Pelotomaculum sp. PtaB.Bin117]